MSTDIVLFIILAAIAIVCAIAMLITRNAVHSALFLVVVMAVLAIFFLGLAGPFIAMVQVTVYAGAIMVLFLFVVMMLGAERVGAQGRLRWQTPLAILLGVALVALGGLLLLGAPVGAAPDSQAASASFNTKITAACEADVAAIHSAGQVVGTPCLIGDKLFTDYLFPFEVVSILIIVAMVGAVVLTRGERMV